MDAPFIYLTMKRILFFITVLLVVCSCQKEIKHCSGNIKSLNDTAFVVAIDGYDISFDTKQARYDNGFVMPGDSVHISYVGDLREKKVKAAMVHLVPKPSKVVDAVYDPTKELKTSGEALTEEEQVNRQKFLENAKKHGH